VSAIVAQADLLSFSLALAACTIALDRATPLSFDSRDSHDSLWTYAVRVEPRATLHHHNVSNTFFRAGDVDRGAFHRFIDIYLVNRFPEAVQWEEIESTRSLSPVERFVELPAILEPNDPCGLVRTFAREATKYEPLYEHLVEHWGPRYAHCRPWEP